MSFLDTSIVPDDFFYWLRRNGGVLLVWIIGAAIAVTATLAITLGIVQWYKHNPAYAVETHIAKAGERAPSICAAERPSMGNDTCTEWVLLHNEPAFANGLQAGEKILLPDGR